jgi:hypothetical protein
MLRFVTGFTGGGKTKFIVSQVIEELRYSDRPILYWMALRPKPWVDNKGKAYPGLLETLRVNFGQTFQAERRLIELQEHQLARFWAWRPVGTHRQTGESVPVGSLFDDPSVPIRLVELAEPEDGRFHLDGKLYGGVMQVVDEAHEYFRKKDFAKISDEALSWASQNRRAGDDAWLLSQQAHLVAKPFRDQSTECYWMVNHAHRVFGPFRQWDKITFRLYLHTPPNDSEPYLRKGELEYRKGFLNGCYDTAAGAGVTGGRADKETRAKGLPWWWIPIGGLALLVAALVGWKMFIGVVGRMAALPLQQQQPVRLTAAPAAPAAPAARPAPAAPAAPAKREAPPVPPVLKQAQLEKVTGIWSNKVYLSTGEVLLGRSVINTGASVLVDGKEYPWGR